MTKQFGVRPYERYIKAKWERRCKSVNYDNLIFKMSEMNYCTEENLKAFDDFAAKRWSYVKA